LHQKRGFPLDDPGGNLQQPFVGLPPFVWIADYSLQMRPNDPDWLYGSACLEFFAVNHGLHLQVLHSVD
jgi:hypothetical protein